MLNIGKERILVAPTEVRCEFLKSSFFVVAVFLWSNRVITRIKNASGGDQKPPNGPLGVG